MRFLPYFVSACVLGSSGLAAADQTPLRIPVAYSAPDKGFASVALYDRDGVLVRTLLAAAPVESGKRTLVWDGTDDLGRPVAAGAYTPKGIFFTAGPSLNWVMKVGKSGTPPWTTEDGSGNWGGNLAHPASITSNGKDVVMVQGCVEDHTITGVQQMDGDGKISLRYHTFYPWDSRSASAMDDKNLYLGILNWGSGLEIAEYKLGEPRGRILTKLPSKLVKTPVGRWKHREMNNLDGLAITAERIYASVGVNNELFIIERASGKILKQVSVPKPYGLVVSNGRLLVVSDTQVLTYTLDGERQGVLVPSGTLTAPNALCVGTDGTVYVGDSGRIAIDIEWEGGTKQIHAFTAAGKPLRRIGKSGGAPRSGRFDSSALGDITGLCIAPGGKSLLATEVTTGFQRTSRWSLDGKLEREWFCRKLECWGDVRNPARPDELVKVGSAFDDNLRMQSWEMDLPKKTWRPAWSYTMPFAQCWQDDVVVGFGHGGNQLKDENGKHLTWPIFSYGAEGGLRTVTGRNYVLSNEGAIYTYAPEQAPKLVAMAFSHRCERQGAKIQTFYDQGPNNWFTWADRNGDQRVQIDETTVTSEPAHLADSKRMHSMWFDDQLNIVYQKLVKPDARTGKATILGILPLKEITADGVPVYDWSQAHDLPGDLRYPDMRGGDGSKTIGAAWTANLIADAGSWFTILAPECAQPLKLPGIDGDGWWAGRNWRKKIARFDQQTGALRWAVGRRAPGVAEPGQMYNPISLAGVAGGAVFAADAMGMLWVWDADGLYLGNLYHGPNDKKPDHESVYIEMQSANVFTHPRDGKIYAASNDFGVSVHEVVMPKRSAISGAPVSISTAQAAQAKPWDPDGVLPTEKPSAVFHRVKNAVKIDGELDGREGWFGSSDGQITAARPMLVLLDGERLATVRGMYDDTNLYLHYEIRAPGGPANAGTELPLSPFTSGAYVDAYFSNDWRSPQHREAIAGDVRVIAAQVKQGGGTVPYHRGFWQVKPGGTSPHTITSPAASVKFDQIAEIPGLQQAWRIEGKENDSPRIRYHVELAIPLAAIGITPTPGTRFGFDCSVAVANPSGDRRDRAAHWGGLSEAQVVDRPGSARLLPENWGTVVLGGEK